MENALQKKWYAVYTKPRCEKKVHTILERKRINSWCPLQKKQRQWSDRKKIIEDPVFKSYVFVRITEPEKLSVLQTDGVLQFVYHVGKPAVIRDEEIEIIKSYLLQKDAKIIVQSKQYFEENTRIKIQKGIFMGQEGRIIRGGKRKIFVSLDSLGQVMIVEFSAEYLAPLED